MPIPLLIAGAVIATFTAGIVVAVAFWSELKDIFKGVYQRISKVIRAAILATKTYLIKKYGKYAVIIRKLFKNSKGENEVYEVKSNVTISDEEALKEFGVNVSGSDVNIDISNHKNLLELIN